MTENANQGDFLEVFLFKANADLELNILQCIRVRLREVLCWRCYSLYVIFKVEYCVSTLFHSCRWNSALSGRVIADEASSV